ncbi:pyridine nucleotide-disulfide oxidoreductase, dimerization domain protein (plasmid) [Paraburkholderia fungorum]|uniref:Pyridine nucleotide-disulfide oxidoreductase, dimerization domain protein n=1 Tax=Paraburkholderia fungorum TaxID=134537 RepID=A0AAP5UX93_9BURK|nr:hypothetical protein [Paraburkholderia fungorum]AJZ56309.1 pyridine nucleotide-disulfide oxidoreductase, dimerization domain protein [Paraburkholderia fungorum]MBB5545082.1 dihydrolipoamide dehydrogenase [Paraburkholderia fungorum]MBU7442453.1 hypothetical protein [Paraburkholderia fungorum]MDE1007260.1 hypothetical protein [Paraburkholderia fungorum]MDT8840057.1 hypothetical protein [Paraburkholderia fungorum]
MLRPLHDGTGNSWHKRLRRWNGYSGRDNDAYRRLCIYLAGDVSGTRELQHEAADEGSIAGWNAARHAAPTAWRRRVPLSIAFTDPDIASIGCRFDRLPAHALIGEARGSGNGRSKIAGHEDNLVRLYADPASGRLLGAAVLSVGGEHLAHLLAWAIQRGETVAGLLEMPFYHPTEEELIQSALNDLLSKMEKSDPLARGLNRY